MVSKLGLMERAIRAHTWTERSMVKGCLSGQTTRITKDLSTKMISMGMASTSGQMEESSKEFGNITRCMARENSSGQTEENILETMKTTRKRVTVYSIGQMAGSTTATGRTASSMVSDPTPRKKESPGPASGSKDRDCTGCQLTSDDYN